MSNRIFKIYCYLDLPNLFSQHTLTPVVKSNQLHLHFLIATKGFIGSHVADILMARGDKVTCCSVATVERYHQLQPLHYDESFCRNSSQ
jgi:hypothetical protein